MVTGTGDFQALFQGLLSEIAVVQGQPYGVPLVKLTDDSSTGGGGSSNVSVNNFPSMYLITGSVSAVSTPPVTQGISGSVAISNFPTYITTSGSVTNFPTWQIVSGSVLVTNLPAVQQISGSVGINNFPNPQIVSGSALTLDFPAYAQYDYISMNYSGTTIYGAVFKRGGSGGATVSTLAMTYDGSGNLLTVTKT